MRLDIHAYFCNTSWNILDITKSVYEVDFTETEYFRKTFRCNSVSKFECARIDFRYVGDLTVGS